MQDLMAGESLIIQPNAKMAVMSDILMKIQNLQKLSMTILIKFWKNDRHLTNFDGFEQNFIDFSQENLARQISFSWP